MVRRKNALSPVYLDFINDFGSKGGFDCIQKILKSASEISELFVLADLLSGPYFYYHLKFVKDTLADCICVIQNSIFNVQDASLRNLKREQIDSGFYGIELLMCRVYTARKKYEKLTVIKISLAMVLLKSELFETRIQGIKIISELFRSTQIFHFDFHKIYLLNPINLPQIIEEIF